MSEDNEHATSLFSDSEPAGPAPVVRNDIRTGDAGERLVQARLLKWSFSADEAGRDLPYDIVTDVAGLGLIRIQVKTRRAGMVGHWGYAAMRGNWRSATGLYGYDVDDFDVTAIVGLSIDRVLFFPGVHARLSVRTEDFLRPGAEEESWAEVLAALCPAREARPHG